MNTVLDHIGSLGVVPVVALESPSVAPSLMAALQDGGLPVAEFTFRTAAAAEAIRAASAARPSALIGAGRVTTPEQVDAAVDAGARFIGCSSLDEVVVRRALKRGVVVLPECATAAAIDHALRLGLDTVQYFPAEAAGGVAMLKALAALFPGVRYVPTGGIGVSKWAAT